MTILIITFYWSFLIFSTYMINVDIYCSSTWKSWHMLYLSYRHFCISRAGSYGSSSSKLVVCFHVVKPSPCRLPRGSDTGYIVPHRSNIVPHTGVTSSPYTQRISSPTQREHRSPYRSNISPTHWEYRSPNTGNIAPPPHTDNSVHHTQGTSFPTHR